MATKAGTTKTKTAKKRDSIDAFIALDEAVDDLRQALERANLEEAQKALGIVEQMTHATAPPLTVQEVTRELGISRPTVHKWIDKGLLTVCAQAPLRVDFARAQEVRRQVRRLRAAHGDRARLVRALEAWADADLVRRDDVRTGVREALDGDTVDMPPLD
jgi:predicted DNA-binding transcriptional regulator AlpA